VQRPGVLILIKMTMTDLMLKTARALAEKGMHVFPCLPRDKRPATSHGLKDATTDPLEIEAWWSQVPDYNVAVVTGAISGVFVVDIDGEDAEAELRKLEQEHGQLPATVESITARGRHLFFRCPKDKAIRNSVGKIAVGVDVRGEGGYVLVAPSVHPSGRRYAWSVDSATTFADAPDWLLSIIAEPAAGVATDVAEWRELVRDGVKEGERNNGISRLSGHLLRRYVDPIVVCEIMQAWNIARCDPPLEPSEVSTIINSICARELARRQAAS
jgi:hypothetical protein